MGSCAAPSAKGDDKFITTDYLQQCRWRTPETPIFPQPFLRCRQGGLRERSRSGFSRMFSYGGLGACAAEAKSAEDRGRYGDGCQLPSLPTRPILSAAPFSGRVAT
ncbi:hypothetical protein C2U51_23285 [Enterobacteriaceae bacterium ENNIH1]|nr:hypothetical protein C2U51_23285 [Enterobacteriaceae bacterium ENNIH1]